MIYERRWLASAAVFSLAGLACARTPLNDPQAGEAATAEPHGVFVPTGRMTLGRAGHTATRLPSGKVLLAGGIGSLATGSLPTASAEVFDPGADKFTSTHAMSVARFRHVATLLGTGQVLIAGGFQYDPSPARVELYVPSSGTFSPVVTRPGNWAFPTTATLLLNGKALVAGFTDSAQMDAELPKTDVDAQLYDPGSRTFTVTGSMNSDRALGTGTRLQDGRVLLVGGANMGWTSAELYDPRAGKFILTGSMAVARWEHTATLLDDGRVLVAGGDHDGAVALANAELFDPATGTFTDAGSMTIARTVHTATLLGNGKVLIAGGCSAPDGSSVASAELYDPVAGTFEATGSMSTGRALHTATLLSDGRVLVAGGMNEQGDAIAGAEIYE